MRRSKKTKIIKIIDDFIENLIKGSKITIDEVLKKYPNEAKELKPLLESSVILLRTTEEFKKNADKELKEFDAQLWQKLEAELLAKNLKEVIRRKEDIKNKSQVALKKRFEWLLLLLYVKGYRCRIGEGIRGITRLIKALFLILKETDLSKLIKDYYEFVPYKLGPFDPAIYQDLKVLESAGLVKRTTYKHKRPIRDEQKINEGFGDSLETDESTLYTLTEEGMRYAKALAAWCDKKDPEMLLTLRRIKTKYGSAPLKRLLKYIYEKYPEYTKESEIIEEILK
jgi:DNA-binding HxlR family transcriptional regulator